MAFQSAITYDWEAIVRLSRHLRRFYAGLKSGIPKQPIKKARGFTFWLQRRSRRLGCRVVPVHLTIAVHSLAGGIKSCSWCVVCGLRAATEPMIQPLRRLYCWIPSFWWVYYRELADSAELFTRDSVHTVVHATKAKPNCGAANRSPRSLNMRCSILAVIPANAVIIGLLGDAGQVASER